jgi:hypothetical protein
LGHIIIVNENSKIFIISEFSHTSFFDYSSPHIEVHRLIINLDKTRNLTPNILFEAFPENMPYLTQLI